MSTTHQIFRKSGVFVLWLNMTLLFIFVFGAIVGSFLGALTYRMPLGIPISKGRSFCPNCKKKINWYDNIPILSYLILKGRCRNCKKHISFREPLIEIVTASTFVFVFLNIDRITQFLSWTSNLGLLQLPYLLFIAAIFVSVLVIDMEHQIIPDELSLLGFIVTLILLVFSNSELIYVNLLAGMLASVFLLLIHIATQGAGMGLGDVKLALFIGLVLGIPNILIWFFISFMIGGLYGVVVLLSKQKKLRDKVAFGPFLVIGFLLSVIIQKLFFLPI